MVLILVCRYVNLNTDSGLQRNEKDRKINLTLIVHFVLDGRHRQKFHCFPPVQFCHCPTACFLRTNHSEDGWMELQERVNSGSTQLSIGASSGALLPALRLQCSALLILQIAPAQSLDLWQAESIKHCRFFLPALHHYNRASKQNACNQEANMTRAITRMPLCLLTQCKRGRS